MEGREGGWVRGRMRRIRDKRAQRNDGRKRKGENGEENMERKRMEGEKMKGGEAG